MLFQVSDDVQNMCSEHMCGEYAGRGMREWKQPHFKRNLGLSNVELILGEWFMCFLCFMCVGSPVDLYCFALVSMTKSQGSQERSDCLGVYTLFFK